MLGIVTLISRMGVRMTRRFGVSLIKGRHAEDELFMDYHSNDKSDA